MRAEWKPYYASGAGFEDMDERYHLDYAAAFVRGKLQLCKPEDPALDCLSREEKEELFALGQSQGLRLHKFKKSMDLPRVKRVIGALKALQPANLLDVGTGRGVFLWPLLAAFPELQVSCIDLRQDRVADLNALKTGGLLRLSASLMNACAMDFADQSFEVITMLEVLEHMPEPEKAISEAARVAARAVIISVPSKDDDNPEHIHLLDRQRLTKMFQAAGLRPNFDAVLNHTIIVSVR